MKLSALLAVLTMAAMALSGCADSGGADKGDGVVEGRVDSEDPDILEAGKGAIEGLLLDDAFRPIHLTDEPDAPYEFTGFILLIETGAQIQTSQNGEFTVLDLDPGTYTLRPQVDGHEGFQQKVQVEEGLFTEVNVPLRRVNSQGSVILTEEYTGFTPCAVPLLVFNCLDASAESYRPGPTNLDYTELGTNVTYIIVEGLVEQRGTYTLQCRGDRLYANIAIDDGHYGKSIFINSNETVYDNPHNEGFWDNTDDNWECILFTGGGFDTDGPEDVKVQLGIKQKYIISIFIGEPAVDLEEYRLLTEDST